MTIRCRPSGTTRVCDWKFYNANCDNTHPLCNRDPNDGAYVPAVTICRQSLGDSTDCDSIAAPSGLTATAVGSQVNLSWTDNSDNETGFEIQRSPISTSGFVLIKTTAENVTSYSDTGLDESTTYYYRVRAVSTTLDLESGYTAEVSVTT